MCKREKEIQKSLREIKNQRKGGREKEILTEREKETKRERDKKTKRGRKVGEEKKFNKLMWFYV